MSPQEKRQCLQVHDQFGVTLTEILKKQRSVSGGCNLGGPLRFNNSLVLWLQCDSTIEANRGVSTTDDDDKDDNYDVDVGGEVDVDEWSLCLFSNFSGLCKSKQGPIGKNSFFVVVEKKWCHKISGDNNFIFKSASHLKKLFRVIYFMES
ncbi:hypothetical protein RUM44_004790 [Polyplax serrata]|uniref:Uncharacterized protein n=1 Tax=Polyplax serrata TaxID=468196 RepID=A0ABR1B5P6_POLSC